MSAVAALYYDGSTALAMPVELTAHDDELQIRGSAPGAELERAVKRADVRVTSRLAAIRRVIRLPDGAQIHCDDNDAVDALFPEHVGGSVVDRLERHPAAVASSLLVGAMAIAWFFFFGLPQIAESIAREIPPAAETLIGEQTMEILDRTTLQPTALSSEQQQDLTDALRRFVADMPDRDKYRLEFRKLPGDLPNAFAIPGGAIVVSDGLVTALHDEDAFLAVIAHEIGHQVHRHVLRQVLQGSAVIVAATLLTGDVSSASGVVLAVPTFLLSSRYSRGFERQADEFAFAALRDRGISPEWFAHALRQLEDVSGGGGEANAASEYVSTHPASQDRIDAALEHARDFEPLEVIAAKQMAESEGGSTTFDAARIVGCWTGTRQTNENRYSHWEVSFGADGQVLARFFALDGARTVLRSSTDSGRWALSQDVMAVRLLSANGPSGLRARDDLQTYLIYDLTGDTMNYQSLNTETDFESHRIDCSKFSSVPPA